MEIVGALLERPYNSCHASYDLRRLLRKGLIVRVPHSHAYHLTPLGRAVAVLFLKAHGRILGPGLSLFDQALPPELTRASPVALAWRRLDTVLDDFMEHQMIAA